MGVSLNGGTPKWLVFVRENPICMDDSGVPVFMENHIPLLVPNAGNGWEWGLLGWLWMGLDWIIPSFPIWNTSKYQGGEITRKMGGVHFIFRNRRPVYTTYDPVTWIVIWRFPRGTPKSSICRYSFHCEPSILRDPHSWRGQITWKEMQKSFFGPRLEGSNRPKPPTRT